MAPGPASALSANNPAELAARRVAGAEPLRRARADPPERAGPRAPAGRGQPQQPRRALPRAGPVRGGGADLRPGAGDPRAHAPPRRSRCRGELEQPRRGASHARPVRRGGAALPPRPGDLGEGARPTVPQRRAGVEQPRRGRAGAGPAGRGGAAPRARARDLGEGAGPGSSERRADPAEPGRPASRRGPARRRGGGVRAGPGNPRAAPRSRASRRGRRAQQPALHRDRADYATAEALRRAVAIYDGSPTDRARDHPRRQALENSRRSIGQRASRPKPTRPCPRRDHLPGDNRGGRQGPGCWRASRALNDRITPRARPRAPLASDLSPGLGGAIPAASRGCG